MPEPSVSKPKVSYMVIRWGIGGIRRIRRIPHMEFPDEATPHQKRQIRGCLSELETDYNGLKNLTIEMVRSFGAPYKGVPCLGNPQLGYLLVKAWIKAMEAQGATVSEDWHDTIREPNKYLNPTHYLDNDYYFTLINAWDLPIPSYIDFDHHGQFFTF